MVISSRPLLSCLILLAASCCAAIAGCSIGEDEPSLYVNSAALAGQCSMVAAETPAAPVKTRLRDSFPDCIDDILLFRPTRPILILRQRGGRLACESSGRVRDCQPNAPISAAKICVIALRAAGVSASEFNMVKS